MSKIGKSVVSIFLVFIVTYVARGDIYLSSFYAQSVRNGYSGVGLVDSVLVDMNVNSGVAISKYTFVVTPYLTKTSSSLDSIEITLNFQLSPDFVADSMWLWIDGKPIEAQIQDRTLALEQYTQIVGRRKDPALLQKNYGGSYSLRIFPAYSGKSRKIAIQFHHTFNDSNPSSENIASIIPLYYDSSNIYIPLTFMEDTKDTTVIIQRTSINKAIKFFSATFTAEDPEEYKVEIPGVGSGNFSKEKSLVITGTNIYSIMPGTVSCKDISGKDEFFWVARDTSSTKMCAGLAATLSENSLYYEDEPSTRIIVLDIHQKEWNWNEYYKLTYKAMGVDYKPSTSLQNVNIWDRAQKYAVLSLTQYLNSGHKFNVLIGNKEINSAFESPVEATNENIQKAVETIINSTPSEESSIEELLKTAISQSEKGIIILISDLYQTPLYYFRDTVDGKIYSIVSETGKRYDSLLNNISKIVKSSDVTLFTIADEYRLSQTALATGGYSLGNLRYTSNIMFHYEIVKGKRIRIPELPSLFGSYNNSGITNIKITSDKMDDIVYTIDNLYQNIYYLNDVIGIAESAVSSRMIYQPPEITEIFLNIAGKLSIENSGHEIALNISGKNRGLRFKSEIKAKGNYIPVASSYRPFIDPQWAFRKSEQLAVDNYPENDLEIKKIGKIYHIVTQRTSLLALEPGMEMWVDTLQQESVSNTGEAKDGTATFDITEDGVSRSSYSTSGNTFLDTISIAELMMGKDIMAVSHTQSKIENLYVSTKGNIITISLPPLHNGSLILRLYDLKGRLVTQKVVLANETSNGIFNWNIGKSKREISRGIYTVHISVGTMKKVFSIPIVGN